MGNDLKRRLQERMRSVEWFREAEKGKKYWCLLFADSMDAGEYLQAMQVAYENGNADDAKKLLAIVI